MNNHKKTQWLLIIVVLLLVAFMFNLCGFGDLVKNWVGIDDDKDDTDDDDEYEDDDYEDEPPDDEQEDSPHCSLVRYSKTTTGDVLQTDTWTALGLSRNTYLERVAQIFGGYLWKAYWEGESLGYISNEHPTRFPLITELRGDHLEGKMNDSQIWWYECMITTGYGGIY